MCQALTGCREQDGGVPTATWRFKIVPALIVIIPVHYFYKNWNMWHETIKLKIDPTRDGDIKKQ